MVFCGVSLEVSQSPVWAYWKSPGGPPRSVRGPLGAEPLASLGRYWSPLFFFLQSKPSAHLCPPGWEESVETAVSSRRLGIFASTAEPLSRSKNYLKGRCSHGALVRLPEGRVGYMASIRIYRRYHGHGTGNYPAQSNMMPRALATRLHHYELPCTLRCKT